MTDVLKQTQQKYTCSCKWYPGQFCFSRRCVVEINTCSTKLPQNKI